MTCAPVLFHPPPPPFSSSLASLHTHRIAVPCTACIPSEPVFSSFFHSPSVFAGSRVLHIDDAVISNEYQNPSNYHVFTQRILLPFYFFLARIPSSCCFFLLCLFLLVFKQSFSDIASALLSLTPPHPAPLRPTPAPNMVHLFPFGFFILFVALHCTRMQYILFPFLVRLRMSM